MDNPEKLETLGTQDTGQRKKNQKNIPLYAIKHK